MELVMFYKDVLKYKLSFFSKLEFSFYSYFCF